MLSQQIVNALSLGGVYALFALGFTLIFGVMGVINLSHGVVFTIGAYASLLFVTKLGLPLWLATLGAMAVSGAVGLAIDFLVLRKLREREAPHLMPMIATIGVAILLTSTLQGLFGAETRRFPSEAIAETVYNFGDVHVTALQIGIIAGSLALMWLLVLLLRHSRTGKALRAIAENPKAAYLLGIDVEAMFRRTAFAAGALGGAAGALIGLSFNAISPIMGQPILPKGIAVIILGGMGDIRGAMIGGLFLGFAEVMGVAYLSSDFRDAISFGLLFLILLLRPQGIFGKPIERKA